jgi:cytochrome P450
MDATADPHAIATPASRASILTGQAVPALLARCGVKLATLLGRPIKVGHTVLAARYADAYEALARDLDFQIAKINDTRMEQVCGAFILGMDRSAVLAHERQALYEALAAVDLCALRDAATADAEHRVAEAGERIDAVEGYARRVAAATAQRLFGISGSDETAFMDVVRAIFAHTFLNIGGDKVIEQRALRAAALMRDWFTTEIARRRASGDLGSDMMGALMRQGRLDDDGVRRTLSGMLVGSIDTTASCVAKIVAVLGKDRKLLRRVEADVDDPARLSGWCSEALRRWPHNPILMRRAPAACTIGGVVVNPGDTVVVWTQAAMQDASAFPDPGQLKPDRPGTAYLHFGGGLHPCAGRAVNAFQLPLLVGTLVKRGIAGVGSMQWAGPFPSHLDVQLRRKTA